MWAYGIVLFNLINPGLRHHLALQFCKYGQFRTYLDIEVTNGVNLVKTLACDTAILSGNIYRRHKPSIIRQY